jgi:flagellar biogenesis protein FliO
VENDLYSLWRVLGALLVAVTCVPLVGLLLRRRAGLLPSGPAAMRVTGSLRVSSTVSLVTVELEGRRYLLSVGPERAELVDRLEPAAEPMAAPRPLRLEGGTRA